MVEKRRLSRLQVRALKRAVRSRCERCGALMPHYILTVHVISDIPDRYRKENILVLCASCHQAAHDGSLSLFAQRLIAAGRSRAVSAAFGQALSRQSKPYMPDTEYDLARLFEESLSGGGMDLFLNGA
jgi:hypothetical protein